MLQSILVTFLNTLKRGYSQMNFSNKKNFSVDLTSGATIPGLEALGFPKKKKNQTIWGKVKRTKEKKRVYNK